jgi:ubiquinone/menaquinone biosynthesis C-methylase UbiE
MGFYDVFSHVYDASLEKLYVEQRGVAARVLELTPDSVVLDVPCGTGQSFVGIAERLGPGGMLVGVDASAGMLKRASQRAGRELAARSIPHALIAADASRLDRDTLALHGCARPITHLHIFLGMSVFPQMEQTFETLWGLLAAGGRCVLVDVHSERLGLQGRMVNLVAGADIRRRFWEPLERVAADYRRQDLSFRKEHGGQIMLAQGRKP